VLLLRSARSFVGQGDLEDVPVFGLGKNSAVVGLDIGSSAVKAVELKSVGKTFKVTAFATEPIPPDAIVDGAIIDGVAVAEAIKRLFGQTRFTTKDVAASL
jgi:type IV pilus assembly protein PilM